MQDIANHVAFGYFTVALLATAAVAFAAGVQFLAISVRHWRDATHLAFAMLCLCVAALAFADAWSDVAGTLATTILALHIFCAAAVLALAALVIFVSSCTGTPANR